MSKILHINAIGPLDAWLECHPADTRLGLPEHFTGNLYAPWSGRSSFLFSEEGKDVAVKDYRREVAVIRRAWSKLKSKMDDPDTFVFRPKQWSRHNPSVALEIEEYNQWLAEHGQSFQRVYFNRLGTYLITKNAAEAMHYRLRWA